ncbi:hypothetical protein [uncultured Deinococcus sp.]|uniref:hypothetical protein n=1 Tax=uncultured Deinococcus sp. TaxID=158789 RepID=UPI0037494894
MTDPDWGRAMENEAAHVQPHDPDWAWRTGRTRTLAAIWALLPGVLAFGLGLRLVEGTGQLGLAALLGAALGACGMRPLWVGVAAGLGTLLSGTGWSLGGVLVVLACSAAGTATSARGVFTPRT